MPFGISRNAAIVVFTALSCSLAIATYLFVGKGKRKRSKSTNLEELRTRNSDTNVLEPETISVLLDVLNIADDTTLEKLLVTISNCSAFKANQDAIRECGGLTRLMDLLTHPNERVQIKTARALSNLAMNAENQKEMQKCIHDAVKNLQPLDISEEAAVAFLQLLVNLSVTSVWHLEIQKGMTKFASLLGSTSSPVKVQKEALKLLVNLSDNPQNFHSLMEFDVLFTIQRFLTQDIEEELTLRAVTCVANIMYCAEIVLKPTEADNEPSTLTPLSTTSIDMLCNHLDQLQNHPNQDIVYQANRAMKYIPQEWRGNVQ